MTPAEYLGRRWAAYSRRERLFLGSAGIALAAAFAYLVLLGPGRSAREQLGARLPTMRAQVDDMVRQQKEIALLRKKPGAGAQRSDLKKLLESSAARTTFAKAVDRLDALSGDRVVMRAGPVAFDDWLTWIEGLQRDFGVRLEACQISAAGPSSRVRIEATFILGQFTTAKSP